MNTRLILQVGAGHTGNILDNFLHACLLTKNSREKCQFLTRRRQCPVHIGGISELSIPGHRLSPHSLSPTSHAIPVDCLAAGCVGTLPECKYTHAHHVNSVTDQCKNKGWCALRCIFITDRNFMSNGQPTCS